MSSTTAAEKAVEKPPAGEFAERFPFFPLILYYLELLLVMIWGRTRQWQSNHKINRQSCRNAGLY
jgi:hypothetical protein